MLRRALTCAVATAAAAGSMAGVATAASAPTPTAANGATVALVASGLQTPTSFAFGNGKVYEGDAGTQGKTPGGVFTLSGGKASRLNGSPTFVSGLAFRRGTLYVAAGYLTKTGATFRILAWSKWNGTQFAKRKTIYTAPKGFQGFNGLAFGPTGRLFVGVDLGLLDSNDHSAAKTPYVYDILTMTTAGRKVHIYARGIRQPWQMAFAPGGKAPFVTNFGQDAIVKNPLDSILHVRPGQNFGFPKCAPASPAETKACKGYAKPWMTFAPHTDNGGIAIVGKTMYLGQFGFGNGHPQVIAVSMTTHKVRTVLTSMMPAAVMAIGVHAGYLYIGVGAAGPGAVYRVKL